MKKVKLIALFATGLVVGIIAGGAWAGYVYSRLFISKQAEVALVAAQEANWLALLRLDETQSAIEQMENNMGGQLVAIGQWSEVKPPDAKTRQIRDRNLTIVKTYYASYPAKGEDATEIEKFLATVPSRNPQGHGKSAVSRLDDLRLSKLSATTNAP